MKNRSRWIYFHLKKIKIKTPWPDEGNYPWDEKKDNEEPSKNNEHGVIV